MTEKRKLGPGRPRSFDTDDVIDAAVELFWRNGYAATTTRVLEQHLGLTQSSLYNAFGSKAELLERALLRYQERVTSTLLVPLEQSVVGLAALESFFSALARWIASDGRRGCMLINLMGEDGGETLAITRQTRSYRGRMRRAFRHALECSVSRGETNAELVGSRADLLIGLVLGINIAARGGASVKELRAMADSVKVQVENWRTNG